MPESGHDIVVIGASAGGVEALSQIAHELPPDLPAAIFVVIHIPAHGTSLLPDILSRTGQLPAAHPQDGEPIQHGHIYIAPPDSHLLIKSGHIRLAKGPRENSHRPAIDPLFRTAARAYGSRVVGIVLSGNLDDGTAGLIAVKMQGGVAIVQDPQDALFTGMPQSAIESVNVDYILPISEIVPVIVSLASSGLEAKGVSPMSDEMQIESDMAELDLVALQKDERPGTPSGFACPECGGALWELRDSELLRFRCRIGHAYSVNSLLAEQSDAMEEALWTALRALEENGALAHRLARRAVRRNQILVAERFQKRAQDAEQQAALIQQLLLNGKVPVTSVATDPAASDEVQANNPTPKVVLPTSQVTLGDDTQSAPDTIIAIAASAGGLRALSQLFSELPPDFPAAITLVQHLDPNHPSQLANILGRRINLVTKQADAGDVLRQGVIYIAPPNMHLLVNSDKTLSLSHSELVHFVRPSADLLFESAAASFKERAIAVVLTGTGRDGVMGVQAIKKMGGQVIAQDQATAEYFGMPSAAINTGVVDQVLPLNKIASTLVALVMEGDVK